ncbi:fibritin [Synechococcus phage S-CRES2]|nr:fibritin [Synechococcus phage S-CRES1]WGL30652.1 fibritin [Synechococcus phage S-CRES2]
MLALITAGTDLYIQKQKDETKGVLFNVVSDAIDNGDYVTVVVTFNTSSGNDLDNEKETVLTVIGGGGSGGATALNDLTDVNAPSPDHGDIIAYNSTSGLWETTAAPPTDISGNSIGDLGDVTIDPALLEKDFGLVYDGTEWVVASPPVLVEGHNQTGATILKATPVYVAGTHSSGKPLFGLADANGSGNAPAIGLTHEDIADGIDGHVMLSGILTNVDTSAYLAGDALYLSTTPGVLTNVRPTAANEKVQKVGIVTRSHATAGSILIIGAGRTNDINNELVALIGAGDRNAVDLGTFTGSTISNNVDVKVALQELETAVESSSGGVEEAPQDGNYYVRQNGTWVSLADALTALENRTIDGGDFINGTSAGDSEIVDGGNFS